MCCIQQISTNRALKCRAFKRETPSKSSLEDLRVHRARGAQTINVVWPKGKVYGGSIVPKMKQHRLSLSVLCVMKLYFGT